MANLSNGPVQTAAWINKSMSNYKARAEVVIVPISGIESSSDVIAFLCGISGFSAPAANAAAGSVGSLLLSTKRTVDDALHELAGGMMNVNEFGALFDSLAAGPVDGVTCEVKTPMGVLLIDRFVFARKTGLLVQPKIDCQFTAFIKQVPDSRDAQAKPRHFFVAVRGAGPTASPAVLPSFPAEFFTALESRSYSGFEMPASINLDGVTDGWQLMAMPRFDEVLGWLRGGYSHVVRRSEGGGLNFEY